MDLQVEIWLVEALLVILGALGLGFVCCKVVKACDTDLEHQKEDYGNDRRTRKTD